MIGRLSVQAGLMVPGDLHQLGRAKAKSEERHLEVSQSLIHPGEVEGPGGHVTENVAPSQSRSPSFTKSIKVSHSHSFHTHMY